MKLLILALAVVILALFIVQANAATFTQPVLLVRDSPLPTPATTPHPPCPPDYTQDECDAAWANLPSCSYAACPRGCVSSIYCIECDESGLNCWANPTPWITNTLGIPYPSGPVLPTQTPAARDYLPLVTGGCEWVGMGRNYVCATPTPAVVR